MNTTKIGLVNYPDRVREYFYEDTHEFLVAVGGGSTSGSTFDKERMVATIPILGYIDLDTGKESGIRSNMKFVINEEERASKNYFKYFEQGKIYRIKGLLPRPLGNELDTELRLSRLYVREIISEGESNDYLKGLFDKYNTVITVTSEILGVMTLDKRYEYYSGYADWMGKEIEVTINDCDEEYDVSGDLKLAEQFFRNQVEWDKKLREFAAHELTDKANDWAKEAVKPGEKPEEITEADFARRIKMVSVEFGDYGAFTIYFGDDDMFWGHCVTVYGSIEDGPDSAQIEG